MTTGYACAAQLDHDLSEHRSVPRKKNKNPDCMAIGVLNFWQGKKDSNLRMLESKSSALTSLATPLEDRNFSPDFYRFWKFHLKTHKYAEFNAKALSPSTGNNQSSMFWASCLPSPPPCRALLKAADTTQQTQTRQNARPKVRQG